MVNIQLAIDLSQSSATKMTVNGLLNVPKHITLTRNNINKRMETLETSEQNDNSQIRISKV